MDGKKGSRLLSLPNEASFQTKITALTDQILHDIFNRLSLAELAANAAVCRPFRAQALKIIRSRLYVDCSYKKELHLVSASGRGHLICVEQGTPVKPKPKTLAQMFKKYTTFWCFEPDAAALLLTAPRPTPDDVKASIRAHKPLLPIVFWRSNEHLTGLRFNFEVGGPIDVAGHSTSSKCEGIIKLDRHWLDSQISSPSSIEKILWSDDSLDKPSLGLKIASVRRSTLRGIVKGSPVAVKYELRVDALIFKTMYLRHQAEILYEAQMERIAGTAPAETWVDAVHRMSL